MSNTNIVGLDLKPSELAVLDAASRIFAAHIAARDASPDDTDVAITCVRTVVKMAVHTNELIFTKGEKW